MGQPTNLCYFIAKDAWYNISSVFDIAAQPLRQMSKWFSSSSASIDKEIQLTHCRLNVSIRFGCRLSKWALSHVKWFYFRGWHKHSSVMKCREEAIMDGKPRVMLFKMMPTRDTVRWTEEVTNFMPSICIKRHRHHRNILRWEKERKTFERQTNEVCIRYDNGTTTKWNCIGYKQFNCIWKWPVVASVF